jgi:hypothetical protein
MRIVEGRLLMKGAHDVSPEIWPVLKANATNLRNLPVDFNAREVTGVVIRNDIV